MFTIMMPAGVKSIQKTQILTLHNHRVPVEAAQHILADGTSFTAASIGIPAVVMREIPAEQRFDVVRDAIVKQFNGKVAEESDIQAESLPGKRFRIVGPNGTVRVQLYMLAGWVWYTVVEGKTKEDVNSKEADAFNSSFHLTEKGKSAADKVLHRS